MTNKRWFQSAVAILLGLLIIKFFLEIYWIFTPLVMILAAIFVPLLIGGVLYYVTEPLQRFMEKKGSPRWVSILAILLVMTGVVFSLVMLIGGPISKQVNNLVESAPSIATKIQEGVDYVLRMRDSWPPQVEQMIDSVSNSIQDIAIVSSTWLVSFVSGAVSATFTLILVPFFFFFMLKDHEKFAPRIYGIFSGNRREWIRKTLEEIDHALRSYVQGQVLISLILAVMMLIGYSIIGLEYALLLAIFAFFMNMIPFIGPWISLAPAVVVALIQDPVLVVWVALITLIAQQVESNLITPNIMGKSLDIHPLTVISLVMAAGSIAGFIGILIAIPTYAVIKVIVINIYEERKSIKEAATEEV